VSEGGGLPLPGTPLRVETLARMGDPDRQKIKVSVG